jgi:hypothetical protein
MLEKRSDFGASAYNGCIYVVGGLDGGKEIKTVEVYDPKLGKWSYDTNLPTRRWGLSLITL